MKKPHLPDIRAVLRQHREGLTIKEIHAKLPHIARSVTVKSALRKMPDAYIDRWVLNDGARGQYESVWCVVATPPHCPYPTDRFQSVGAPRTRWVEVQPWQ